MTRYKITYKITEWHIALLLTAAFSLFAIGCGGSGLDVAPVEGVVTLDGNPVHRAAVVFRPKLGPVSTAVTDEEGHYRLVTGKIDGALVGEHLVTVAKAKTSEVTSEYGDTMGVPTAKKPKRKRVFPAHYAKTSTSGLEETVVRGERNTIELHLTSKESK